MPDRIDNDGPYAPGNCRWATLSEQNGNRRGRLTPRRPDERAGGATLTADDVREIRRQFSPRPTQREMAQRYGVSRGTIWNIIRGRMESGPGLTPDDVRAIRAHLAPRPTQRALAPQYGVTKGTIWEIVHRRTWRHVLD